MKRLFILAAFIASTAYSQRVTQSATSTYVNNAVYVQVNYTISNSATGTITQIDNNPCLVLISYNGGANFTDSQSQNCGAGGVNGSPQNFTFNGTVNASGIAHSQIVVKAQISLCNDTASSQVGTITCNISVSQTYLGGVANSGGNPSSSCFTTIPSSGCSQSNQDALN